MTSETVVRKGRKFARVLAGARDVFLRDGFHGASVDDIARAAGVSKATLYAYVPDKRQLFVAVLQDALDGTRAEDLLRLDSTTPPDAALMTAARSLVTAQFAPGTLALFRLCVAESARFPEVGRAFFDGIQGRWLHDLAAYLEGAMAAGRLAPGHAADAAAQFLALTRAGLFDAVLFGLAPPPDAPARERLCTETVATFLARHGVQPFSRSTAPAR